MAVGDYPSGLPIGANADRLPPWLNQLRGQFRQNPYGMGGQALPSAGVMPQLGPAPEIWAHGQVPGQTPNFMAQGTVPGRAIPMGPGGSVAQTLAPSAEAIAMAPPSAQPQPRPNGGVIFADPNAPRPAPTPRASAPRGPLTGGTFIPDGNGGLQPIPQTKFFDPKAPIGGTMNGQTAGEILQEAYPDPSWTDEWSRVNNPRVRGKRIPVTGINTTAGANPAPSVASSNPNLDGKLSGAWSNIRGGKPIGSSLFSDKATSTFAPGKTGLARRGAEGIIPGLAWQTAGNFVNSRGDGSVGPVDKGLLNSMVTGGSFGAFGGVPGSIAGATGAGVGDLAMNVAGGDLENEENQLAKLGKAGLRSVGGVAGSLLNIGDWMDKGDTGGLSGLMGSATDAPAEEAPPTPQALNDRIFDMTQTPADTRGELQNLYDIMIANGGDPAQVGESIRQAAIEDYTTRQQEERSAAQVLAQQSQARKYMQPYADSLRNQGLAEQQLLTQLSSSLPAAYQGYGQYAANSAVTRANSLADAYMMQASMAPGQYQQQQAYAQQQAINNQLQQRLQAQGITEAVDMYNAGGGVGTGSILSGQGGGL